MTEKVLTIADDFLNIRGDFKIGGVLNIGTHASLVRRANGRFVLLDAYRLSGAIKAEVDALTQSGRELEAIINLHPFHTVHVEAAHAQFPQAKLYGTRRHHEKFPHLPWEGLLTESAAFADAFAEDFEFSVPAGVDFISANDKLHFASVLAYHKTSRTVHVDDTLMYLPLPGALGKLRPSRIGFHPTLGLTLQPRPGAAEEFRQWARGLISQWSDTRNLCAAHSASVVSGEEGEIPRQIEQALARVEKTLKKHERRFG